MAVVTPQFGLRNNSAAAAGPTVRVTNPDRRGYVEFQFSLGDPNIYLEMTLPLAAFAQFCENHKARHLSPAEARAVDDAAHTWLYGDDDQDPSA
jgi:phenol hydroxylase P0 protein